jgi:hypothetical protein
MDAKIIFFMTTMLCDFTNCLWYFIINSSGWPVPSSEKMKSENLIKQTGGCG